MVSISRRYTEAAARLARLEKARALVTERPAFANPLRHCPTCGKDVGVTTTRQGKTELSAICVECGADLAPRVQVP